MTFNEVGKELEEIEQYVVELRETYSKIKPTEGIWTRNYYNCSKTGYLQRNCWKRKFQNSMGVECHNMNLKLFLKKFAKQQR